MMCVLSATPLLQRKLKAQRHELSSLKQIQQQLHEEEEEKEAARLRRQARDVACCCNCRGTIRCCCCHKVPLSQLLAQSNAPSALPARPPPPAAG